MKSSITVGTVFKQRMEAQIELQYKNSIISTISMGTARLFRGKDRRGGVGHFTFGSTFLRGRKGGASYCVRDRYLTLYDLNMCFILSPVLESLVATPRFETLVNLGVAYFET
jgi:hypothetical protein